MPKAPPNRPNALQDEPKGPPGSTQGTPNEPQRCPWVPKVSRKVPTVSPRASKVSAKAPKVSHRTPKVTSWNLPRHLKGNKTIRFETLVHQYANKATIQPAAWPSNKPPATQPAILEGAGGRGEALRLTVDNYLIINSLINNKHPEIQPVPKIQIPSFWKKKKEVGSPDIFQVEYGTLFKAVPNKLVLYIVFNVSSRDIRHFLPDRVLMIMSKIMDFQDFAILSDGMVQIRGLY